MAKNYVKPGDHIAFTATANVASGGGVAIGVLLGVALVAVANGATGEAAIKDVWELPKLSGAVITAGARLTWDVSAGEFILTSPATGDLVGCAVAVEGAGSGVTKVKALLCPGSATISA